MTGSVDHVLAAIRRRHHELIDLLNTISPEELTGPSSLPGWSRLTIACHLRHGARASQWMTEHTLADETTAFYPGGRDRVRPATLVPTSEESHADVITSLAASCDALGQLWDQIPDIAWEAQIREPDGHTDLGSITIAHLALLRLTEVEVHGTDLALGASRWSKVFIDEALPMRLEWLASRRRDPMNASTSAAGRWRFRTDELDVIVCLDHDGHVHLEQAQTTMATDCVIEGSKREILSYLLGRVPLDTLNVTGDRLTASRFHTSFPPP